MIFKSINLKYTIEYNTYENKIFMVIKNSNKKFIVIQLGSRMNYAVPTLIDQNKDLASFYTDIHSSHLIFKLVKFLIPGKFKFKKLVNLLSRKLPIELNKKLVKDQVILSLLYFNNMRKRTEILFDRVKKDNFSGATAIYTNFINDDIELIRKAKESGLEIIHEVIITPNSGLTMLQEYDLYPNIEFNCDSPEIVKKGRELDHIKWELSDKIIVASKVVQESLLKFGVDSKKIFMVPYGLTQDWFKYKSNPKKGKILFVGIVGLRKGVHYLAEAARILEKWGYNYEIKAVGLKTVDTNIDLFKGPKYLGHIPRNKIINEYLSADVFVLPTLVDGFGLVHLEAMACGVPVITTKECGSVVEHNKEGFIIPSRDPIAIANAIIKIVENRDLRDQMSKAAKAKAIKHTWKQYSEKLMNAIYS